MSGGEDACKGKRDRPDGEYEVGYGKPPKHTRFQMGKSGNPRGRTKGSLNFRAALQRALLVSVTAVENGRKVRCTKEDLLHTQLVNAAAKGNLRAIDMIHKYGIVHGIGVSDVAASAQHEDSVGTPEDQETFNALIERLRERSEP